MTARLPCDSALSLDNSELLQLFEDLIATCKCHERGACEGAEPPPPPEAAMFPAPLRPPSVALHTHPVSSDNTRTQGHSTRQIESAYTHASIHHSEPLESSKFCNNLAPTPVPNAGPKDLREQSVFSLMLHAWHRRVALRSLTPFSRVHASLLQPRQAAAYPDASVCSHTALRLQRASTADTPIHPARTNQSTPWVALQDLSLKSCLSRVSVLGRGLSFEKIEGFVFFFKKIIVDDSSKLAFLGSSARISVSRPFSISRAKCDRRAWSGRLPVRACALLTVCGLCGAVAAAGGMALASALKW